MYDNGQLFPDSNWLLVPSILDRDCEIHIHLEKIKVVKLFTHSSSSSGIKRQIKISI